MKKQVYRSFDEHKRIGLSWEKRWEGPDRGLIACWEVGRDKCGKEPELAEKTKNGELPTLGWKGGVEKETKKKEKYGSLYYLAQWQGLRGEDLDIDFSQETVLICSKTGIKVTYTADQSKYVIA